MRKYPPDVNISETCIDANLKMVERQDPFNFSVSHCRNDARGQYPKLPLNIMHIFHSRENIKTCTFTAVKIQDLIFHGRETLRLELLFSIF